MSGRYFIVFLKEKCKYVLANLLKRLTSIQNTSSTCDRFVISKIKNKRKIYNLPSHFSRICTVSPISRGKPCCTVPRKLARTATQKHSSCLIHHPIHSCLQQDMISKRGKMNSIKQFQKNLTYFTTSQ